MTATDQTTEPTALAQPDRRPASAGLFDLDAEQAVLGAIMLSRDVLIEVTAILRPAAFYRPIHATIFTAIVDLDGRGEPADAFTVAAALAASGDLARVGGAGYLHTLVAAPSAIGNGPYYARIVAEQSLLRGLAGVAERIERLVHGARSSDRRAGDLIGQVQQWLADLEDGTANAAGPVVWNDIIPDVMNAIEEAEKARTEDRAPGLGTGLHDLDQLTTGLHPGQLVVIAGRPGVGKSVGAVGIAQNASWRLNATTVVFSLEMSRVELGMRMMSAYTQVPLAKLKSGDLSDEDWTKIARAMGQSESAPLYVDDTASLTLADIRTRSRALKRQHGLSLIVVDYLQLMSSAKRSENRQQEVAAMSRGLKLLAKELAVPVIAVSQLNRGPEQRTDKRPTKADLRESGAIENDADVIILLHRDDYYDPESPRAGECDWILDKNRHGPTDTVTVASQLHLSRFASMAISPEGE